MTRRAAVQLLGTGLLIGWCLIFFRSETTEQSVVRAVLAEPAATGWSIGLLYQFPEAAADSAEADVSIRFCFGRGETPQAALAAAEENLPQKANYRLCDHLVLGREANASLYDTMDHWENLLRENSCGRLSARVFCTEFSIQELADAAEEKAELPEQLLQTLKTTSAPPRLYEHQKGCLLPVLTLEGGSASCRKERLLVSAFSQTFLFLTGKQKIVSFDLEGSGQTITLTRRAQAVEMQDDGFRVELTAQHKAGTTLPPAETCRKLENLICQVVQTGWEQGSDLLQLGAAEQLRTGQSEGASTKNVCPQLRADVVIY